MTMAFTDRPILNKRDDMSRKHTLRQGFEKICLSEPISLWEQCPELKDVPPPETPYPSFQRKLESSAFQPKRHWIPAFAGMTNAKLPAMEGP